MIRKIMKETLHAIFIKRWAIIKTMLPYLIIMMIIDEVTRSSSERLAMDQAYEYDMYYVFIALGISFVVSFLIAVKTHRVLLLNERDIADNEFLTIGFKEFKFLFASIILTLIASLGPIILIALFTVLKINIYLGLAIGIIFSSYIVSRLSLVLPSIAIERDMTFKESWELTREFKFLSYFIIILYPIIISLVLGLVYGFAIKFLSALLSVNLDILMVVLNVCITVLIISALSVLYQNIVEIFYEKEYELVHVEEPEGE